MNERVFLTGSPESAAAYREAMAAAGDVLLQHLGRPLPYSGATPGKLSNLLAGSEVCPEEGEDLSRVLRETGKTVVENCVRVAHPGCAAHLQCPPLVPALAAEAVISATNQSMDSWDQAPAATLLEERVVRWLCGLFGYRPGADGVFTSGGTQSNLMGLLPARDRFARERFGWSMRERGLPPEASRFRILCSEAAHFSVGRSAALLGLGERAVVPVETDAGRRMSPEALDRALQKLEEQELLPVALVATAGTTDFGSIDPLEELASRARELGLWLHVDAAYGGALALSERHRSKLAGIEDADSVAVDFHKGFYQPVSCAAFLVRRGEDLALIRTHADYLNPEGDDLPNLAGKSLQTTRRFDAFKLYVSLRALGRRRLAAMVERTVELAKAAAALVREQPGLELAARPQLGTVVFRYRPARMEEADRVNAGIRRELLLGGEAVVARTRVDGRVYLKLTLLNPLATPEDLRRLVETTVRTGKRLEGVCSTSA
ncbi:L-2,4-diaminobutyrate decarboxylase [Rubrobacter xylanophilus]|uniref:L-2,4-diaminobutyrate decarboxylase n=2 Tax=Rubrobacter xylanophilus TaxID=49319 RepID=A0A510HLQ1_9ACTN|nr:aspartate aminotransferase family protein [Rubrobacter xylanophilus]BBL80951.1 L-2,4-diaminobutyrate decarboxylase [Rubrobacter xylanophilus]